MNTKCVYFHRNRVTQEVFYVGQGTLNRAKTKHGRSKDWYKETSQEKYIVEIVIKKLSREQASTLERMYIAHFGRKDKGLGPLVNHTDGGAGSKDWAQGSKNTRKISPTLFYEIDPFQEPRIKFISTPRKPGPYRSWSL